MSAALQLSERTFAKLDQADGLRPNARYAASTRGPRFIAVTRVPWSDHASLVEDLAHAFCELGKRVLIVGHPAEDTALAETRFAELSAAHAPGRVVRVTPDAATRARAGLRAWIESSRERYDIILVELGTAPDDIDIVGLTPDDEMVFLAQQDVTVLFRTYALLKDLCVRRRVKTLHLVVGESDGEQAARGMHRTIQAVASSFLRVSVQYAGHLPRVSNAWRPTRASIDEINSKLLRQSTEMRRVATILSAQSATETASQGGTL
ncbi:MAG: hypothetical protein ACI81R_000971 [Bradymonadia bacterium]|jgi:hypothetical protein